MRRFTRGAYLPLLARNCNAFGCSETNHLHERRGGIMNKYLKFVVMIAVSTVVMFGLMYLNTYQADHIYFSETRAYMALVMGATMAIVMLAFMLPMYENRRANVAIVAVSVAVFAVALWLVRSQTTVDDVSYMRAMIPHHSIAILTSDRARISDPRVRKLADGIIETQRREIGEMKALIDDLEKRR
jgi:peptidoglycan/LPS O-acetylase OafA/YrhL